MLEAKRLTAGYRRRPVIVGLDFVLRPGEWVALLGPNGSGKTTLLLALLGLLPSSGEVRLSGRPLAELSSWERGRRIAFLPQETPTPEAMRVREVVALGRLPYQGLLGREGPEDREAVAWAMAVTGVEPFADRALDALSGGERQRVFLARALAARPRYLFLDEPTNHLDLAHQARLLRLLAELRDRGLGVLTVLHDPNHARGADRVVVLEAGRKRAEGGYREVLPEVARLYRGWARVAGSELGPVVLPVWEEG